MKGSMGYMTENKRFRIYQDLYEDFYIEDIESYNNQKLQRSYKVGNEEDVKYENVENIVDLLNKQEEHLQQLKKDIKLLLGFYRWYPFAPTKEEHETYNRLWDFVND